MIMMIAMILTNGPSRWRPLLSRMLKHAVSIGYADYEAVGDGCSNDYDAAGDGCSKYKHVSGHCKVGYKGRVSVLETCKIQFIVMTGVGAVKSHIHAHTHTHSHTPQGGRFSIACALAFACDTILLVCIPAWDCV